MLKSYFDFSRKELSGIFVLAVIVVLLFGADLLLDKFAKPKKHDYSVYLKELDSYMAQTDSLENSDNTDSKPSEFKPKPEIIFIDTLFNANLVDSVWLISKGFSPRLTRSYLKYRSVLKGFKNKQNIRDIYGMSAETFSSIESYIFIEPSAPKDKYSVKHDGESKPRADDYKKHAEKSSSTFVENPRKPLPNTIVDINSADTTMLKLLPGIGSSFALRIVKYRNIVGGYVSKNQLLEVYGFTPELLQKISPYIALSNNGITTLSVNKLSVKALQSHPYIDFYQAKAIIEYRQKVKRIANFEQLFSIPNLDTTNLQKARQYFVFE